MSSLNLSIKTIKLGSRFVAATTVGGFTIRGNASEDEATAVLNLLYKISNQDDGRFGVDLALAGETLETALLSDGNKTTE